MEQPTLWQRLTGSVASVAKTVKDAVTPKAAEPLLSDAVAAKTLGAAPETAGTTITGGRRRRTRKARKGRKTRRGHRKH
jgi:hypothetical protein